MKRRGIIPIIVLLCLALLCAADLMWGGSQGLSSLGDAASTVLLKLRLPRMLTALLAGSALALGGLQMQSIFRNPLADPHIMGVSAGAGLGAALVTMAGAASLGVTAAAFVGALACSALVMLVSSRTSSTSTLLIFGIMLGFIVSAAVALLQFTSSAESLKLYYSWAAGSFSSSGWTGVSVIASALVLGTIPAVINGKGLDLILFGDAYASLSGANVKRIRIFSLLSCSLLAGTVTAFCGPLGFVGIAAPHIARRIIGSSVHKLLIPASLLTGAVLSVAADLFSRLWGTPLPAGSILAIIGIPVILIILLRK